MKFNTRSNMCDVRGLLLFLISFLSCHMFLCVVVFISMANVDLHISTYVDLEAVALTGPKSSFKTHLKILDTLSKFT